jgi:hypothetical protein
MGGARGQYGMAHWREDALLCHRSFLSADGAWHFSLWCRCDSQSASQKGAAVPIPPRPARTTEKTVPLEILPAWPSP